MNISCSWSSQGSYDPHQPVWLHLSIYSFTSVCISVYLYSPAADIEGVQLKGPGPCVSHSKTASG